MAGSTLDEVAVEVEAAEADREMEGAGDALLIGKEFMNSGPESLS